MLINLDIPNFNINDKLNMEYMFSRCSNDLKNKIKSQNKNIKNEAFDNLYDSDDSNDLCCDYCDFDSNSFSSL